LLGSVYTNAVGAEMVYIPPGEFMLGSTKEEQAWALANGMKEEYVKREGIAPLKAMMMQGFWMGRTEVTVGQWRQFVKATGYVTDGEKRGESYALSGAGKPWAPKKGVSWRDPDLGFEMREDHPVSCISWNDAVAFCGWLTEQERKAGRLAQGYEARLPTEVEWEYACRGGTQTKFWWGDSKEDGNGRLNWRGKNDGFEFLAPVDCFGSRGRNAFGLADMLGNVAEWCLDEDDPAHTHVECFKGNSSKRVLRGGAFSYEAAYCRCASRGSDHPSYSVTSSGFRLVVGVELSGAKTSTASPLPPAASSESGVMAPVETRVAALTTNPKVGEVCALELGGNVTLDLMGIPPGEFLLGSTKEEREWALANGGKEEIVQHEGEAPRKAVIKEGFWMGRTEVTVGQWKQFVVATGFKTDAEQKGFVAHAPRKGGQPREQAEGVSWRDPGFGSPPQDNQPVCCISWNDAKAFCDWLNGRERAAGRLPTGSVVRLPTEAEWEYACRAGTATQFWWGDTKEDGRGRLNWEGQEDGFAYASPVDAFGSRGRNGFGLADMLGNVWERCLDEYDGAQAHEERYQRNPRARVLRGGSFIGMPAHTRCATRNGHDPARSNSDNGFRVAVGPAR